jgi:hypothetical protein
MRYVHYVLVLRDTGVRDPSRPVYSHRMPSELLMEDGEISPHREARLELKLYQSGRSSSPSSSFYIGAAEALRAPCQVHPYSIWHISPQ